MTPFLEHYSNGSNSTNGNEPRDYTLLDGTHEALEHLLARTNNHLPEECLPHIAKVGFATANSGRNPYFPGPLKQTEAISALKAVEAGVAASIAELRYGQSERNIKVDMERASAFLFSTYLVTVGGMNKFDPKVKTLLKGKW